MQKQAHPPVEIDLANPELPLIVRDLVREITALRGSLEWAVEHRHALRRWLEETGSTTGLMALDEHLTSGWVSQAAYLLSTPRYTFTLPAPPDDLILLECPACGEQTEAPACFCWKCRADLPQE